MTDITKLLRTLLEEELPEPPVTDEEESSATSKNVRQFYTAIKNQGLSDKTLLSFQDDWNTIKSHAQIIATTIEQYRAKWNIPSDLTGEDLTNQVANSLVRLKLYFYLAMGLFQDQIMAQAQKNMTGQLNAAILGAKLRKPTPKAIKTIQAIFMNLPDDLKQIALDKDDLLSNAITASTKEESFILNTIEKIFLKEDLSSLIADDQDAAMDVLFDKAFVKFLRTFLFANVKDLPNIDEDIYLHFSNPSKINTDIRDVKLRVAGIKKNRGEFDTKGDLYSKYEPISGDADSQVINDLSNIQDPTEVPQSSNPDSLSAVTYDPKNAKEAADKEIIFTHSNLLLKYFNTPNWASLVAEELERLRRNPGSKITYFNNKELKFETKELLSILFDDTDEYLADTVGPASLLTFDVLTNVADTLVSVTGEAVPVTPEILATVSEGLLRSAQDRSTDWFNISDLPSRYKEEIRQYLKLENIPSFNVANTALKGNSPKEKYLDMLQRELLTTQDGARKRDLQVYIAKIQASENPTHIDALAKLAGIAGSSMSNIKQTSATVATPSSDEDKKLAKKVGDTLYDKFAVFLPGTTSKAFEYSGRTYSTRPELASLILTLSPEELNTLWTNIQNGSIPMNDRNKSSFMSQTGASGQTSINGLTAAMTGLLKNKGGITEAIATKPVVERPEELLRKAYIAFFTKEATPILQSTLVILKKLSTFLIAMIRLFEAYNKYLNRSNKSLEFSLSNEEILEIDDLQSFFTSGPNKKNFAADLLLDQLRNGLINETAVTNIINAFEANVNNPAYTNPIVDPIMQDAFVRLRDWLVNDVDPKEEFGFRHALAMFEKQGKIDLLQNLLYKLRNHLNGMLSQSSRDGSVGTMSKKRLMDEIIRGTYGTPLAQKEAPDGSGAELKSIPFADDED